MKRSVATLVSLILVAGGVAAGTLPASAAPPTDPWSASAGGSAASIALDAGPVQVAGVRVVDAASSSDSQAPIDRKSVSIATNALLDVLGAKITAQENRVAAPPDAGPVTGSLADVDTGIVDLDALTTVNEAHWAGDGQCTVGTPLASTTASVGTLSVLGGLAAIDNVSTTGTTALDATGVGFAYDVLSTATGSFDGATLLGGLVRIDVSGETTLTARSNGTTAGTVDYAPATVTVTDTVANTAVTLGASAGDSTTITVDADTSVTVSLNQPVITSAGTTASATSSLLTIGITDGFVTARVDLLPLSVSAAAPAGGLDCSLPAPSILVPAAGTTVRDATPTISGTGLPGAFLTVSVDGTPVGSTTVTPEGTFTLDSTALAAGPHSATATQTLGELGSPTSATVPFVIDLTPPAPPVIQVPEDGATTPARPPISGTAVANASVEVFVDGASIGTTTATPEGTFALTPAADIANGDHVLTARATDSAGTSLPSNSVDITVDGTPPAPPVIVSPLDNTRTNDTTPTVTGTAEAGTTVRVTASPTDGTPDIVSAPVAVVGTGWTLDLPTLVDGSYTLTARATDAVGNTSGPSNSRVIIIDTVAPAAPVITAPLTETTTTNPRPTISGTADATSTSVTVIVDGNPIGTAPVTVANGAGAWTFVPTSDLAEGQRTITATARDATGNVSAPSNAVVITVDAVPPAAPTITSPPNGSSTNDPTPVAVVATEPNAAVSFQLDGAPVGTSTADSTGTATLQLPTLADGVHTLVATASTAGGTSPASAPSSFTVDTAAPPAPVITSPAPGSTTGPQPPITGTSQPGTTVQVTVDGRVVGTGTTGADGTFTVVPNAPLPNGTVTATAVATDAAGNASAPSAAVTFTVARGRLAQTGMESPLVTPIAGGALLLLGAVLMLIRRRHDRSTQR